MKQRLRAIFHSYSDILFLHNGYIGIVLLASTLFSPNVGIAGIIAIIAAYLFARFIEMGDDFLAAGFYTYNPLLVGLSIGFLFTITPLTICFIIAASIFTFVLTVSMSSIFSYYLKLPVLSIPFGIVSSIVYLASSQFSNLFVTSAYATTGGALEFMLPYWLEGFFKSLGALFFLPYVLPGMLFALNILIISRILFLLAFIGYLVGTSITGAMEGSYVQAFSQLIHFNYILISMSVGGIFLIPSSKSYIMAFIAVFTSTIVLEFAKVFYMYFGIPGFAFPFNFVTLSFVYVLGTVNFSLIARFVKKTPEETLDYYLSRVRRYKGSDRTLALPFSGKWNVWQGFDSKWTHQFSLKHAYDFVITDQEGKTHRNTGGDVKDYYCFRKPILSPVRGRIISVVNNIDDNPIGEVDQANNWGNLVVIHDPRGYYIEISHFVKDSIVVKKGDWVERGVLLGLCGNSGYSPQPHIHIQVQALESVGSYTIPFSFISYLSEGKFFSNNLPDEDTIVEPLFKDKIINIATSFMLDDVYKYEVRRNNVVEDKITLVVKIAEDGTFYFDSGRGKLYFGKHEGTFYFYYMDGSDEYLKAMFLALPRLPLVKKPGLSWTDFIPIKVMEQGWRKEVVQFISSFNHSFGEIKSTLTFTDDLTVEGKIFSKELQVQKKTFVEIDNVLGFKTIRVDDLELRRIKDEKVRG